MAILPRRGRAYLTAKMMGDELQPVTNPQHRHTYRQNTWIGLRSIRVIYRARPARKNYSLRLQLLNLVQGSGAGKNNRKNIELPYAPRNQLRILRAKVQYDDRRSIHISSVN